jgi:hypothetical protein
MNLSSPTAFKSPAKLMSIPPSPLRALLSTANGANGPLRSEAMS